MRKIGLLTLSLLCLAATAGAATALSVHPPESFTQFIDGTLQPVLKSIVAALTPVLIAFGCRFISKVTGINVSQASQRQLEGIAEKSVLAVEEKAAASLKVAGEQWSGYQKHKEAVDNVLALAPSLSREQADLLVHWAIAKIPGLGATGVLGGAGTTADTGGQSGGDHVDDAAGALGEPAPALC